MTSGDFYRYCEICYETQDYNYYGKNRIKLSPKEKYLSQADGRDCGMRSIDGDDPEAFEKWYEVDSRCGGHPWEICRGGNSTHISLYVKRESNGWRLILDGSSRVRVAETVTMAVELHKKGIPIDVNEKKEILRMIKGEDFLGVVPHDVTPKYCHGSFPAEDNIIDFVNPWFNPEVEKVIKEKAVWYPIKPLCLRKH